MAVFTECHGNVHAGVLMELISGGASVGTARPLLRSTLTRQLHRVPDNVIAVIAGTTPAHAVSEMVAVSATACECQWIYPIDETSAP